MPRTRIETAKFVIDSFRALGINPHSQSRLMRMHRLYTEIAGVIPPTHPQFETALEAERDMQQLAYILEREHAKSAHAGFKCLLRKVVDDSVLPQDDRGESKGRNTQFELYVAAVCQAAGFLPVDYQEPDVTCTIKGAQFGVAAKRLMSVNQTKKRVPKAARQIEATGVPGVIALDTTLALNPNNIRVTAPIPEREFVRRWRKAINDFLSEYEQRIRNSVSGRGIVGVVVQDHQVRYHPDGEWGLVGMTFRFCTAEDDASKTLFDSFQYPYLRALPNMQDV